MAELVVRLNLDTEDVELVLDGKVVDTVGNDVLNSWVDAINAKREAANPKPVAVDAPVEDKTAPPVEATAETPVEEATVEVDTAVESE